MPFVYSPTPVEEAYALFLLRSVFRRDYADTDFQLDGRSAVPFFTLSGQDRLILRNIWNVADPANVGTLTDIAQFHTCLRLIALAQCGILGQALGVALQGPAAGNAPPPAVVMAACLQATAPATGVPLPRFAGIEMPPGAALQLIYRESRQHRQQQRPAAPGRSGSGDSHSAMFLGYQSSQVAGAVEDSDRTVHTSNLRRTLSDEPQDESGTTGLPQGIASPGPTIHPDTFSAPQSFTVATTDSQFPLPLEPPQALAADGASARKLEQQHGEDDFGEFASTEPTGWDALDALVDIQDAPLPQLGTNMETEPNDHDHYQTENESEPVGSQALAPLPTAAAPNEGDNFAETGASVNLRFIDSESSDAVDIDTKEVAVEASSFHVEQVSNNFSNANDFEGNDDFGDFVDHAPNEVALPFEPVGIIETAGELSSSGASPVATISGKVVEDEDFGDFIDQAPTEIEPSVTELPSSSPGLAGWDALDALAEHTIQVDVSTTARETTDSSFESTTVNVSARSNLLDISHLGPFDDSDDVGVEAAPMNDFQTVQVSKFGAVETLSDPSHGAFDTSSYAFQPPKETDNIGSAEENESNPLSTPYGLERTFSLPVSPSRSGGFRAGIIERVSSAPGPSAGWDAFDELATVQDAPLPKLHDMSANQPPGLIFSPVQVDHEQANAENSDDNFGAFDSAAEFQSPLDDTGSSGAAPIIPEGKIDLTDSLVVNISDSEPLDSIEYELSETMPTSEVAISGYTPNIEHVQSTLENDEHIFKPSAMTIEDTGDGDDGSDDFGDFADHIANEAQPMPEQSIRATSSVEDNFNMINIAANTEPVVKTGFDSPQATTYATGSASPVPLDSGYDAKGLIQDIIYAPKADTGDNDSFGDFDGADLDSKSQIEASETAQLEVAPGLDIPETETRIAEQLLETDDMDMVSNVQKAGNEHLAPNAIMHNDDFEFGDFADFQEAPAADNVVSNDNLNLRSQIVSSSLELPEMILRRDNNAESQYVDLGDCFDANIGTDQPLDDERSGRVHRCLQVMQLLSSSHSKLASTYWDQALIVIQDELAAGTKLLSDAAQLKPNNFASVVKKLEHYVHGLGEFVRISRSIAATLGDLLMLDRKALLTSDTLASSWCSMTLIEKTIQVERLWSDVEKKANILGLVSKQNTDHRLESIVDIRLPSADFDCRLCHFTLRPLGTDSRSTKSGVLWDGQSFMACSANFLSHKCPFYVMEA